MGRMRQKYPYFSQVTRAALAGLGLLLLHSPVPARAFCGFFVSGADAELVNNASQVALLRKGNRTVMTMSNNYKGPPQDFAMVVPVPTVLQKEQVKTLSADVFRHIDQLSAPRLVEYWEQDPCAPPIESKAKGGARRMRGAMANDEEVQKEGGLGVKIEAKFEVGEYQILILSARDSSGLSTWLSQNHYNLPKGAAGALAPYVRDQMKFFVAKVDIKKVKKDEHGAVVLSPLRFYFDAPELRLPVRLGLLNAAGKQDLIVYILHPDKRFEVANYPNLFIPTNIEVADKVRTYFGSFYAELFDETLRRNNNKGVVTEYAWQTSGCDPCPTPPLDDGDLMTLGSDVLDTATPTPIRKGRRGFPGGGGYYGSNSSWVLTRLHTRYDQATLSEDLIFHEAQPLYGGRADGAGGLGDKGAQMQAGGVNNFQGRYIIRHYWPGAVSCSAPQYGVWGGPPNGGEGGQAKAAQDLANAPRGKILLKEVVNSPLPTLGIAGKPRALRKGEKPPAP